MTIGVAGAGAFGTALAISLAEDERPITLWARNTATAENIAASRINPRLPGVRLPDSIHVSSDLAALAPCDTVLLATPAQALRGFVRDHRDVLADKALVACCKGIDLETLSGPTRSIGDALPGAVAAMLTGPSFADDIARGLPTALTLACTDLQAAKALQQWLSTANLRIYTTPDVIGAELGGALKNVIAIGCGAAIGAGMGVSARAALMTRGFREMQVLAERLGADPATLTGLSGFGDLALTCTSDLSRNYRFGVSIGAQTKVDEAATVEGAKTALAVVRIAEKEGLDLPVMAMIAALSTGELGPKAALESLLSRPLRQETDEYRTR